MKKRVLSCFMALALCLTLLPAAAWAEEADPPDGQVVEASGSDDTEKQDAAAEADEPEDTAPAMQKSPAPTAAQSAENVAEVTSGGTTTPYADLPAALAAAKDGDTIKLLANATVGNVLLKGKTVTLDLNGKTVKNSGRGANPIQIGPSNSSTNLIITGSGSFTSADQPLVVKNGTLDLSRWTGDNSYIYRVTLSGANSQLISPTGAGQIDRLAFIDSDTEQAADTASLNGGRYGKIVYKRGNTIKLGDLLAEGYAFRQNGTFLEYAKELKKSDTVEEVEVVRCTSHVDANGDKRCDYCNTDLATGVVATLEAGGATYYYTNLSAALSAAKAGDTLTLLADVQGGNWVTIDKAITFDLNGHEIYYELTVKCKITLKDSAGGTGKIALWLRVENGLTVGDLLEPGYALRNADTKEWYGETEQTVRNLTVQQAPITSVTLTALNADGTAASTSIPYGTTGGIKLSAGCTKQGAAELSCQWYTIGGTLQLIDGAKGTEYNLPADLSVGKHSYCVTFTADGYSKSADITITVTATNKIVPTGEPTLSAKTLTYGQALSAIKLSGKLRDNVNNKDVEGMFAWVDGTVKPNAGSYEAAWKFTPADGDTYAETTGTVSITVNKVKPTGDPIYTKITAANKTLKDAALKPNTSWPTGTIQWVDKDGKGLENTTEVKANTAYKWIFTPDAEFAANYTTATGELTLYSVSTGGGGGGGSSSGSTVKTDTTTKPDGTKVQTETRADGTKIQTETKKDGSTVKTTTNPNGSSVTESKDAAGSTGTVKTDKNGQTTAETTLSSKAIEDAKKSGEPVKAPVEVKASRDSSTAPTVKVELPKNSGDTKVEIPVSNVKPGTVAVLVHSDGTEEIVKNSLPTEDGIQLTVNGGATVKIVDNSKGFIDTRDHWAKDAIDFVSARGLVNGMSATIYAPNASTTRAQLWTILARQNNADLTGGSIWYEKAQNWAKEKGISDGTNPNGTINRAQMVTMLYRAAGSPEVSITTTFTDVPADSYYAKAVAWAVENGITAGVGGGRFDPNSTCTRAQIATFLYRLYLSR